MPKKIKQNEKVGIRNKYRPSKKEYEALQHVYERYREMKDQRADWEKVWDEAEKQYNCERDSTQFEEWQSDIYIPLTTSVVEAMLAELTDLNLEPLYLPREPSDQSGATVMNHIFKYTWEIGGGAMELYKVIKDSLIYGTGIAQEYYLQTPRKVKELVKFDLENEIEEYEDREMKDYDDCYMESVKLQDFFVDERARGFSGPRGAKDCIRRYIMHIDDFRDFFKGQIWDHLKNAKYVVAGGDTNYFEFYKPPEGMDGEDVEVLWYWNKPDDKLIIIANDVVVRNTPNPYKHKQLPFARAVDIFNPHQFYGTGEPKLLRDLQKEQNIHRRMLMDRGHLDIDKMFLVSSRDTLDEEQLIARPHGMIEVEDVNNSIKPMEYGDLPRSVFQNLELMREDIIRVTGYDDRMQSVQKTGTATEAAIIKESSLRRVRGKVFLLGREFLIRIASLRMTNIQQYYSVPKVEKIVGEKDSREYRETVAQAKKDNRYRKVDGEDYEEKYRTIRINDRELRKNKKGEVTEVPHYGWTFFETDPESLTGNMDISITAGPVLPVSKPLLQQRTEMLAQHPVIAKGVEMGVYDIIKIGDSLFKAHDFNPDDFKKQEALAEPEEETMPASKMEREVELASVENEQMMKGKAIGPTAYITQRHTEVHLAFMNAPQFMELPNESPIVKIFANHVGGEIEATRRRGPSTPQEAPEKPKGNLMKRAAGAVKGMFGRKGTPAKTPAEQEMGATMPGKISGSSQVQKVV